VVAVGAKKVDDRAVARSIDRPKLRSKLRRNEKVDDRAVARSIDRSKLRRTRQMPWLWKSTNRMGPRRPRRMRRRKEKKMGPWTLYRDDELASLAEGWADVEEMTPEERKAATGTFPVGTCQPLHDATQRAELLRELAGRLKGDRRQGGKVRFGV